MPPVLSVERVRKSFGGVAAVNDVSLALEPGRIYGLIGPNGSGKTTLFNCITGIERLDAGRVSFRGERIDGLKPWQIARRGIGRTFQIIRVFPELTALENLLVVTRGARAEAERRGRELLEFVRLGGLAGEYAGNLSYGQQKLVEFVRMLMTEPMLILLDEPAAGVNRTLLNDLLDAVSRLRDAGKTVLLVEHDMKVVMGLCETVFVLDHGEKIAEGPPGAIPSGGRRLAGRPARFSSLPLPPPGCPRRRALARARAAREPGLVGGRPRRRDHGEAARRALRRRARRRRRRRRRTRVRRPDGLRCHRRVRRRDRGGPARRPRLARRRRRPRRLVPDRERLPGPALLAARPRVVVERVPLARVDPARARCPRLARERDEAPRRERAPRRRGARAHLRPRALRRPGQGLGVSPLSARRVRRRAGGRRAALGARRAPPARGRRARRVARGGARAARRQGSRGGTGHVVVGPRAHRARAAGPPARAPAPRRHRAGARHHRGRPPRALPPRRARAHALPLRLPLLPRREHAGGARAARGAHPRPRRAPATRGRRLRARLARGRLRAGRALPGARRAAARAIRAGADAPGP